MDFFISRLCTQVTCLAGSQDPTNSAVPIFGAFVLSAKGWVLESRHALAYLAYYSIYCSKLAHGFGGEEKEQGARSIHAFRSEKFIQTAKSL